MLRFLLKLRFLLLFSLTQSDSGYDRPIKGDYYVIQNASFFLINLKSFTTLDRNGLFMITNRERCCFSVEFEMFLAQHSRQSEHMKYQVDSNIKVIFENSSSSCSYFSILHLSTSHETCPITHQFLSVINIISYMCLSFIYTHSPVGGFILLSSI